jgi:restriction system protein
MPVSSRLARYMNPVLEALCEMGGSARPRDIYERVAHQLGVTDAQRAEVNATGVSRFTNDVAWTRFYLVRAGYVDSPRRGVWALTKKGLNAVPLSEKQLAEIVREVQAQGREGAGRVPSVET